MSYRKGARLEYWVKHRLEKENYYVVRSAGSHGEADLIAFKKTPPSEILFIQISKKPKPVEEIERLIDLCNTLGVTPCIVFKNNGRLSFLKGSQVIEYVNTKRLKLSSNR
ncbi:MAG: hypothetical protein QW332_06135 [Thermoproteota archaeon]